MNSGEKTKCKLCNKEVKVLKDHMRMHKPKDYSCKKCDKTFHDKTKFTNHEMVHTGEKPHQCQYCQKGFINRTKMKYHERTAHTGQDVLNCTQSECKKTFATPGDLDFHTRFKHSKLTMKCKICKRDFKTKTHLKVHEMQVHQWKDVDCPYSESSKNCQFCNKLMYGESSLRMHEQACKSTEKPNKCKHCQRLFATIAKLKKHQLLEHTGQNMPEGCGEVQSSPVPPNEYKSQNVCEYCGHNFSRKRALQAHQETFFVENNKSYCYRRSLTILLIPDNTNMFPCQYCDSKFQCKNDLVDHREMIHKEKLWPCNECSKAFLKEGNMIKHKLTHSTQKLFQCQVCKKPFKTREGQVRHEGNVHGLFEGTSPGPMVNFIRSEQYVFRPDESHKFPCKTCEDKFETRDDLINHMGTSHGEKPWPCDECPKIFKEKTQMAKHALTHSKLKQHHCSSCPKQFRTKDSLTKHARKAHGLAIKSDCYKRPGSILLMPDNSNMFPCQRCDSKFQCKNDLVDHREIIHKEKLWPCNECSKAFLLESNLIRHKLTHSTLKLFQCQDCKKPFKTREGQVRHEGNMHGLFEGTDPMVNIIRSESNVFMPDELHKFPCKTCEDKFETREDLINHMGTSHGEQPWPCDECPKIFKEKAKLARHVLTHSKLKQYYCSSCSKQFKTKEGLTKHARKAHGLTIKEGKIGRNPDHPKKPNAEKSQNDFLLTKGHAGNFQNLTSELVGNENGSIVSDITSNQAIPGENEDRDPSMDDFMEQFWCIFCNMNFKNEEDLDKHEEMHD